MTSLTPVPQGEEPGGLPFGRLLPAVFRARYLVFGTTLFGILIGAFLAITTPNNYVSTGKFLFTASGAESKMVDPTRATEMSQETIGTAATYILNTDDLLRRVIDRLTPARILEPYLPGNDEDTGAKAWFYRVQRDWNATKESERTVEGALKRLRGTLSIERPRFTDVLIATCSANNQLLAQEILATYMDEAVKWHIEQYDDKRAYEEAEKAAKDSKIARDAARLAMREFLDRKARVSQFDDEKKRLEAEELAATTREAALRQEVDSKKGVLERLTRRLEVDKEIPPTKPELRRIDFTSNTQREYEAELGKLTLEQVRLEAQLRNAADPQLLEVIKKRNSIQAAMTKLLQDARNAPMETVDVENPDYLDAQRQRSVLKTEIWTAEAQLTYVELVVKETRNRLKSLLELEPEFVKLRDALLSAEDYVVTAQSNWNAAQQKRALGLGNFSSLKRIESASYPLDKEGPNRSKLLISGMFVGLFLGLGIILLRALPDSVVRTRDDLERIEGLPVIGVMPRLDGSNLRRHVLLREQGW